MNKTKIILSVMGGVILVAVLAMMFLTWMSFSAKTAAKEGDDETGTDGLDTVMERVRTLSAKKPYPCDASVKQISSNREAVVEWKETTLKFVAERGKRVTTAMTPVAFQGFISGDADRIRALPAAGGTLAAADFDFGPFKEYVSKSGGKIPEEAELATLQRKWYDFAMIAEMLSSCGIVRLTSIAFADAASATEAREDANKGKKPMKKAVSKAEKPSASAGPDVCKYTISFLAKPSAFVKSVNAFATSGRFMVVENFSFVRESDAVKNVLDGGDSKEARQASPGRRRRGRRGAAEAEGPKTETEEGEEKKGGIIDPKIDPPLVVTMTISVYDFKSVEATKEEGK